MRAVSLLFHDVAPAGRWELSGFQGADADVYKLACDDFRRHLAAISEVAGTRYATADELLARRREDRPVLLTFDDGGVSALLYIADLLDEVNWKAHFFITAGRIGDSGFLDRGQIQELRRRGHLIGTHSYSHPLRMALCSDRELDEEWGRSALTIADILGEPTLMASVPGGYYSRRVALAAARAGIELLFNSEPETKVRVVGGCLVLGRFTAQRRTPAAWSAAIVAGRHAPQVREYLFWNAKKIAKFVLGSAWLRSRRALLERRARSG
jgi:peptidoglycan/xylan/chitin deacetylase (PgdA/CDA1 family)